MYIAVGKTHKHCCFQALQNGISLPEVFGQCMHHPHGTAAWSYPGLLFARGSYF